MKPFLEIRIDILMMCLGINIDNRLLHSDTKLYPQTRY